MKIKAVINAR